MGKYDLIIFDCDGTLVDTEEIINRACSNVLNNMGYLKYTPEYCLEQFTAMSAQSVIEILNREIGSNFDAEEFWIQANSESTRLIETEVKPIPNAIETLSKLSSIDKCVASNGNRHTVIKSLEVTGLIKYFNQDVIFTYELVSIGKPAPDLFLYVAEEMGAEISRCLVIEDSIIGVTAAKSANMDVLAFAHPSRKVHHNLSSLNPTGLITDFREILNYIN
jgi:HAD superfamily hydrolase (TIGR01509 family)